MANIFYDYVLDELRLKDVPDGSGGFYGSFYDTTTHTVASTTTAYPITLNTTISNNGVSIGSPTSRIVFDYAGIYSITFSVQYENTDNQAHASTIWLRKNGTDVPDSSSYISVPSRHGGTNGKILTTVNYVLDLNANDYIEVYYQAESTDIQIVTIPAGTTPTTPVSPSIILTAVQGGIITQGSTSNSLASLTDVSFTSLASGQIIMSNASGNWGNVNFPAIPSIPSLGSLAVLNTLDYSALTGKPSLGSLAVLNSLSYTSLSNLPSLGSLAVLNDLSYTSLLNLPSLGSLAVLNSLSYYALDSRLSLGSLAVQNNLSYFSLDSRLSLGSLAVLNDLSYTSLLNLPSLGSLAVQNNLSYFSLDSRLSLGSLAVLNELSYTSLTNLPSLGSLAVQNNLSYFSLDSRLSLGSLAVLNSLSYTSLTNLPSLGSFAIVNTAVSPLVLSGATLSISQASIVHNNLGGLTTGDPHTQYALLAGRSGGQTLFGGTVANNPLSLRANSATGNSANTDAIRFGVSDNGATNALVLSQNGKLTHTVQHTFVNGYTLNQTITGTVGDSIGAFYNVTDTGGGGKTIFSHRARLIYSGATILQGMQATSNQAQVTGGGTVNALEVLTSNLDVTNNSTVVDAKLIRLFAPTVNTGGSIGTLMGLAIPNLTQGTTNYSIYAEGGTMYHAGNVGIAMLPSFPLDVTGDIRSSANVRANNFLGNTADSATAPSYTFEADTNTGMYHPTTDNLGFTTAGTERIRIN